MQHLSVWHNIAIWAGFWAWVIAQVIKLIVRMVTTRKFDPGFLFRLAGMPSSHSALAVAVATSCGLSEGFDGPVFAIAAAFAAIVMFDAQSVRRAAGQQARLVNQIVEELFKTHRFSQQKLAELLGHTRLEVLLGAILGIVTALLFHSLPW
jgi:uncharacterized protein